MKGALLGPQRDTPTVLEAVRALGVEGEIALVTAGWQEREDQDEELHQQLERRTVNLRLYQRGEEVFAADATLRAAHRARQERLRHRQEYYRLRLARAVDAALDIRRLTAGSVFAAEEDQFSIEQLRQLDADHLARCREINRRFDEEVQPLDRPAVVKHRQELKAILSRCQLLAIAGGHVAVLLNRLRLFGLTELLDGQAFLGWAGGAMVAGEKVVLFHESPPQGEGVSEVLDEGLGLHRGIVVLPNPRTRLVLEDSFRVGWMARRYGPERCVAFDYGESVRFEGDRYFGAVGTHWLKPDGTVSGAWT